MPLLEEHVGAKNTRLDKVKALDSTSVIRDPDPQFNLIHDLDLIWLKGNIGKVVLNILYDSGSSCDCLTQEAFNMLNKEDILGLEASDEVLLDASNNNISTQKIAIVKIVLNDDVNAVELVLRLHIIDALQKLGAIMILGIPFTNVYGPVYIDIQESKFVLPKHNLNLRLQRFKSSECEKNGKTCFMLPNDEIYLLPRICSDFNSEKGCSKPRCRKMHLKICKDANTLVGCQNSDCNDKHVRICKDYLKKRCKLKRKCGAQHINVCNNYLKQSCAMEQCTEPHLPIHGLEPRESRSVSSNTKILNYLSNNTDETYVHDIDFWVPDKLEQVGIVKCAKTVNIFEGTKQILIVEIMGQSEIKPRHDILIATYSNFRKFLPLQYYLCKGHEVSDRTLILIYVNNNASHDIKLDSNTVLGNAYKWDEVIDISVKCLPQNIINNIVKENMQNRSVPEIHYIRNGLTKSLLQNHVHRIVFNDLVNKEANIDRMLYCEDIPVGDRHIQNNNATKMLELSDNDLLSQFKLDHIPTKYLAAIKKVLVENRAAFATHELDLGTTKIVQHEIRTTTNEPVRKPQYRMEYHKRKELDKLIDSMLEKGILRHSISSYNSPCLLLPKKKGGFRLITDFRALNAVTINDNFPIPRADECFNMLNGAKIFTSLDLQSGFYQIELHPDSREKTAFSTYSRHLEYIRLPMGLVNSPRTFQRCMFYIFRALLYIFVLVYLDDILIYSKNYDDHVIHLDKVLKTLAKFGLKIEIKKCEIGTQEVTFLGLEITENGFKPGVNKVDCVRNFPVPKTVKAVRSFIGLCSFYRKFCPRFADIAIPLNKLLRKNIPFKWTTEQHDAFEKLKELITTAPFLMPADMNKEFILQVDASDVGIGSVLLQAHDKVLKPISYNSRKLNSPEMNYSVLEKEMLAAIWAIQQHRHLLYGNHFVLMSDNSALKFLLNSTHPKNARHGRWISQLQQFDFTVKHIAGNKNAIADALSRNTSDYDANIARLNTLTRADHETDRITRELIEQEQHNDKFCRQAMDYLDKNETPDLESKELRKFLARCENLAISNGVLIHIVNEPVDNTDNMQRTFIPDSLINRVLAMYHDHVLSGHFAIKKMLPKIKRSVFFFKMYSQVANYCENCLKCKLYKKTGEINKPQIQNLPVPMLPGQVWHSDYSGALPVTRNGNKYILGFIDSLSKYIVLKAVGDKTSETIARVMLHDIILVFGLCDTIITDHATEYHSNALKKVYETLGITKHSTTPYHACSNAAIEVCFKTIKAFIRILRDGQTDDWDSLLPYIAFNMNTSKHAGSEFSPFYIMYGRQNKDIIEHIMTVDVSPYRFGFDEQEYIETFTTNLNRTWEIAKENNEKNKQEHANRYNEGVARGREFKVGDIVLLSNHKGDTNSRALTSPYNGPYFILQISDTQNATLQNVTNHKVTTAHISRLRFYRTGHIQGDTQQEKSEKKNTRKRKAEGEHLERRHPMTLRKR